MIKAGRARPAAGFFFLIFFIRIVGFKNQGGAVARMTVPHFEKNQEILMPGLLIVSPLQEASPILLAGRNNNTGCDTGPFVWDWVMIENARVFGRMDTPAPDATDVPR